jgi:hypothetical protein
MLNNELNIGELEPIRRLWKKGTRRKRDDPMSLVRFWVLVRLRRSAAMRNASFHEKSSLRSYSLFPPLFFSSMLV